MIGFSDYTKPTAIASHILLESGSSAMDFPIRDLVCVSCTNPATVPMVLYGYVCLKASFIKTHTHTHELTYGIQIKRTAAYPSTICNRNEVTDWIRALLKL